MIDQQPQGFPYCECIKFKNRNYNFCFSHSVGDQMMTAEREPTPFFLTIKNIFSTKIIDYLY